MSSSDHVLPPRWAQPGSDQTAHEPLGWRPMPPMPSWSRSTPLWSEMDAPIRVLTSSAPITTQGGKRS